VQALKEVTFSVRQGECFVLLGHNGAGKSTLINILTGVTRPTHGKAFLAGDSLTMADLMLFAFIEFGALVGQGLDPANSNLVGWRGRMSSRASVALSA
jgi:ABC-type cobalamin/Fe3+-siderophores transport system ATPase subunit